MAVNNGGTLNGIALKDLLEAGVHFGHQTKRWNPKMKQFIFGERNGIYIIDLAKTAKLFRSAEEFVHNLAADGRTILFVGTKRQAQDAIAEEAQRSGMRLSTRDVAASLNGVPAAHRLQIAGYGARDVIVFAEIGSAVGFIVWTAMLYTLFAQLTGMRLGFAADRVVAMRVPSAGIAEVAARVAGVPGVARVAISSGMLFGGSRERIESGGTRPALVSRIPVGEGFFDTLGVPLVRGRM